MPFFSEGQSLLQLNQATFDFGIQFEQLFFAVIPSALFIAASSWRTCSQARKPVIVNAPVFQLVKLAFIAVYLALEIALLILATVGPFHATPLFTAASALRLVSALLMIALSLIDHSRSPRPSVLLNGYLTLALLLDAAQLRTLFLSSQDKPEFTYSSVFGAALALKATILLLEAKEKSRWVSWDKKEHSPEETSSIFSLSVYFWLNNMFMLGYRKVLKIKDLYPLDISLKGTYVHGRFSNHMDYSKMKGDKFGLVKVLTRTLAVPLLLPIPARLALLGFTFSQPFFLETLLNHLSQPKVGDNVGYGLIGVSVLIYSGIAISTALYWYFHRRMLAMARSILVTETFIKATEARIGTGDDSAALTLMSTDIERISVGFLSLHEVWACFIQIALAAWMLYNQLGVVFVAPIGIVTVCFVGLVILMRFTGDSQRAWMSGVQKRVGLTATVIASMKSLKISGLSAAVGDFVQKLREDELAAGARFRTISVIAALFGYIPLLIGPPLTFAFAQRTLDITRTFTSLSYLLLLTNPLSQVFQSLPQIVSGFTCLGRIQAYLEREARDDFREVMADTERTSEKTPSGAMVLPNAGKFSMHPVVIANGDFGWEADKFVLKDVNTYIVKSSLTMVVGPVGSGKSTLCKALLGEIPFKRGSITLSHRLPRVGFCDQTAFLFNGTIQDNIVGFSSFDSERYAEVIEATALKFDLDTLVDGDKTNIGSDGITLSGGQKQRVCLARALYLQSDLLILDDIFSGLDADTEEQVFQKVFGPNGLLKRRRSTVVLCTHSIKQLPAADNIVALGDGTIIEQGSFNNLMRRQGYVQGLGLKGATDDSVASSHTDNIAPVDSLQEPEPEPQLLNKTVTNASSLDLGTDATRQIGDGTVYKHYFQSMGWLLAGCSLFFASLWGFFTNFPTIWLTYWSGEAYSVHPAHSYAYYAGIYFLLQVSGLISLLLLGITLFIVSVKRAGANVHRDALRTLMRAPLRFFTVTDSGAVTNLFSQDLNLIDTELPNALLNTLFCNFQAIGQAAVMLTSSPYLAISYPFLVALLYVVQRFYLRTSRQLRILDLEAKTPLYTHFIDTVKGVTTLRAFGFVREEIRKNSRLIDLSQRPAYLLVMIQQWLNLVLDIVVMILAAVLTTLAVRLHSNSGFAGASLVTLMSFGENLSGIVIFYTRLETSIGAIARLKAFNEKVQPEDKDNEDIYPPEQWPHSGIVELKGVSASYSAQTQPNDAMDHISDNAMKLALCDINLTIFSGEKIAICGRTGSGKSSLIALLLKLLDPLPDTADGITIDGTPLHRIERSSLRQRIIALPQEAVFLPDGSTFQANLDPLDISTAEECQDVLMAVKLWPFVQERGGLEAGMSAGTLSAGQRQLMSLGRALLRRRGRARNIDTESGILLLDEVSSSVDHETERVMQEIIRTEFKAYTVIVVSHRLEMIMDFDRVVVMDRGRIVEIGNPMVLAEEEGTWFGKLVSAGAK